MEANLIITIKAAKIRFTRQTAKYICIDRVRNEGHLNNLK